MKKLAIGMLMMVVRQLLVLDVVHNEIRKLAKKSDNVLDDLVAEKLIELLKEVAPLL